MRLTSRALLVAQGSVALLALVARRPGAGGGHRRFVRRTPGLAMGGAVSRGHARRGPVDLFAVPQRRTPGDAGLPAG